MLQGLLKISADGAIELLTEGAEGVKFKLTDEVDIADDGVIYFSDASCKYGMKEFAFELFEGRPHGRLLSYDPSTKQTTVLVRDLYFANGVVVSPDQNFVVFCETFMYVIIGAFVFGYKVVCIINKFNNLWTRLCLHLVKFFTYSCV